MKLRSALVLEHPPLRLSLHEVVKWGLTGLEHSSRYVFLFRDNQFLDLRSLKEEGDFDRLTEHGDSAGRVEKFRSKKLKRTKTVTRGTHSPRGVTFLEFVLHSPFHNLMK